MARFDLNLLSALDVLLTERNVTRAAEKLNLTQPTVSGMLQRLRYQFDDQLLVRNGRHMELTPFAESLIGPVRDTLCGVELLMCAEPAFDPATSTREFTIMASDYCTSIFMPYAVADIMKNAPSLRIITKPISSPVESIIAGEVDLCITADDLSLYGCDMGNDKLQSELLFSDEFICIVANDHPLVDTPDMEVLLSFPHVGVEMTGAIGTIETVLFRQYAPYYRPNVVVPDFSMVASIVAQSNLIGVIQARLLNRVKNILPIRPLNLPVAMPKLNEAMFWHSRHMEDPAHIWLRNVMRRVLENWQSTSADESDVKGRIGNRSAGRTALHVIQ